MVLYGTSPMDDRAEHHLRGMVALGDERTIQQDTAFAIRIMVDIALMALSPAVNAPTTAVQVLDYLGETLREIGATDLEATLGRSGGRAESRVVMRGRRWEDFLTLGVTEIREYGAPSIQVMRRLRAMLAELHDSVRPENRSAVVDELARLDATIAERWGHAVDLDRVRTADGQGIGGPTTSTRDAER